MFSRSPSSSALPADQQSVVPTVRGLPWWGAILLATAVTIIGALVDTAPSGELGRVFKVIFIFGCVLAALAVRRRAMFTAAVQPPLIAFGVGLIALYLQAGDSASDKKTLILKVVLPVATSFPWMLIAFVLSVAIVLARLFFTGPASKRPFGGFSGIGSKSSATRPARKATPPSKRAGAKGTQGKPVPATKADADGQRPVKRKAGSEDPKQRTAREDPKQRTGSEAPKQQVARGTRKPAAPAGAPDAGVGQPRPEPSASRKRRPAPAGRPDSGSATPRREGAPTATKSAGDQPSPARRPRRTAPVEQAVPAEAAPTKPRPRRDSDEGTTKKKNTDRQRAQPQKIPARPRRTAGQQLRERGDIEDLTAGLDD